MAFNLDRWSLKTKVTIFTLSTFLAGIWSLTFFASWMLRGDMEHVLGEAQHSTVSFIAREIDGELRDRRSAVETAAATIPEANMRSPELLRRQLEQSQFFMGLFNGGAFVTAKDGTVLAAYKSLTDRIGRNYGNRDYIAAAINQGQSTIGSPVLVHQRRAPCFAIASPIRNVKGEVIGALAGVIDLNESSFLDIISKSHYGVTGGYLLVSGQDHLVVTASNQNQILGAVPQESSDAIPQRLIEGADGYGIGEGAHGMERLASAQHVPVVGWQVMATLPLEEAFAPIYAMQVRIVLFSLLLTLITVALMRWMLREQLSPLASAAQKMATMVALKQPLQKLPVKRPDEIGQLIQGFNQLVAVDELRKQALMQAQNNTLMLVKHAPIPLAMFDTKMNYLCTSDSWLELFACDAESLHGRNHYDIFPDLPPEWRQIHQMALSGQTVRNNQDQWQRADGTQHWLSWAVVPWKHADASIGGIIISVEDIIERKRTEMALQASEARLSLALSSADMGTWDWHIPTGELLVNAQWIHMLGYTSDELPRRIESWKRCIFKEDAAQAMQELELHLRGETPNYESTYRVVRKNGELIWVQVNGKVVARDDAGHPMRLTGTIRDISNRKVIEAQLAQALEAAEAANAAKSEFLAHMSHEIRTPMNAIIGAARLMDYEPMSPTQRNYVHIMQKSSQSLLALTNAILDLSKIEAGHAHLRAVPFDLRQLTAGVAGMAEVALHGKDLTTRITIAPDVPSQLLGDPVRLEQILSNLMSNAIKFTEQGEIALKVKFGSILEDEIELEFSMEDTGIGIASEHLSTLFDAFVQVENMVTRIYDGTGLGLAICRQLVHMMGGNIRATSTPGQGSCFSFTAKFQLPPADAMAQFAPASASDPAPVGFEAPPCRGSASLAPGKSLSGGRVLIVEDNEFNSHILEKMLQHLGLEADLAWNGIDALDCFQMGRPYDIILMDLHMPGMGGTDCVRAIRAMQDGDQVPIIALTANVLSTTAEECLAAGMNDYVTKPIEPEALHRMLVHWIGRKVLSRPRVCVAQTPDPDDRLPEELPGIVLSKAAFWCNNSRRALILLLDRMLASCENFLDILTPLMASGQLAEAAQRTHDLIGLAATVGASALADASMQLDQELRAGMPDSPAARQASAAIAAEFAHLRSALQILQDPQ